MQRYLRDVEGISDLQGQFLDVQSGASSTAPATAAPSSQGASPYPVTPPSRDGVANRSVFERIRRFDEEHQDDNPTPAFVQGATLGFGDEITARLKSLSPDVTYEEALADERAKLAAVRDKHPGVSLLAEGTGAIMSGKPLGAGSLIRRAISLPGRIAAGATEGAIAGGVYGAGAAEEGERGEGAVIGGALGATVGGVLPAAGRAAGAALDVLGLRGAMNPAARADKAVLDAIQRSGTTPGKMADAIERRAAFTGDAPEVLADQSENLLGLTRAAQARPSTAKDRIAETLTQRARGQGERLVNALETWAGTRTGNVRQTAEALVAQQKATANKLYQEAFKDTRPIEDPALEQLLRIPYMQEAIAKARHLVTRRGDRFDEIFSTVSRSPSRADMARRALGVSGEAPAAVQEVYRAPTIETMDRVKKGLDELIALAEGKAGKEGLGPEAMADVTRLKMQLVDILDRARPAYAKARSVFAGDAELQRALESGRRIMRLDPREAAEVYARMTPGEQALFRQGAINEFRRVMEQTRGAGSAADRLAATAENLQRVKAIFQGRPQEEDRFLAMLERELRMSQTTKAGLGNSVTARLQEEARELATNEPILGQMSRERSIRGPLVQRLLDPLSARLQGVHGSTADALAPLLTAGAQAPADLVALLRRLQAPAARQANRTATGAAQRTAVAGVLGGQIVPRPGPLLLPSPVMADMTAQR